MLLMVLRGISAMKPRGEKIAMDGFPRTGRAEDGCMQSRRKEPPYIISSLDGSLVCYSHCYLRKRAPPVDTIQVTAIFFSPEIQTFDD